MVLNYINKTKFMRGRRQQFGKSYPRLDKVSSVAGKVFGLQRQVRFIKGIINSEKNYMEVSFNSSVSATANVLLLTSAAQGDDETNRSGRSVLTKSAYINGQMTVNGSATCTFVRVILFIDKNSNGTAPAATEVLVSSATNANLNQDNAGSRFIILADKHYTMYPTNMPGHDFRIFRKLNLHTKWDGTSAAQADCVSGHLYLLMVSNEAGANPPTLNLQSRIGFYDN